MWFDEAGEVMEIFRGISPLSLLVFLPLCILISPICPASAAHEFTVYRLQQYDLQGSPYGCSNALLNVEARPVEAASVTRRCIVAKLAEITSQRVRELALQNAGGLLVLLPENMSSLDSASKEHLLDLESDLVSDDTQLPVYFVHESDEMTSMYQDIKHAGSSEDADSAAQALVSAAYANGFQLVVNGGQSKALNDFQVVNIQGKLAGYGVEDQLPTIAIVAHYDAHGVAPSLSFGADSNGSGVAALLELARLFSKLYTNSRTHAKFNLLFLLSGAGKYNYQGTKRWIEDQLDNAESSLLTDVSYVLCLDSLGQGDSLHLHVSKPPKLGSPGDALLKSLEQLVQEHSDMEFSMLHKKINLAEDFLAWEHERFSIRRLHAFTLSHFSSYKDQTRKTVMDTRAGVDDDVLSRNVHILAEALARHIFNLQPAGSSQVFSEGLQVEKASLSAWVDYLSSEPRSAQLLGKDSAVVTTLTQTLQRHLKDVRTVTFMADKRDPDFLFYDGTSYTMNAYNVKPAVFDLFLALGIAAYLGLMFLFAQNFGSIYTLLRNIKGSIKPKHTNGTTKSKHA